VETRDLGEYRLKDLTQPQRLYQLLGRDLDTEFAPLRTLENRPTNLPAQATPFVGRAARSSMRSRRCFPIRTYAS
jgi:hypothetical protein